MGAKGPVTEGPVAKLLELLPGGVWGLVLGGLGASALLLTVALLLRGIFLRPMSAKDFRDTFIEMVLQSVLKGPSGAVEVAAKQVQVLFRDALDGNPATVHVAMAHAADDVTWRAFREWSRTTGLSRSSRERALEFWRRLGSAIVLTPEDLEGCGYAPGPCVERFRARFIAAANSAEGLRPRSLVAPLWEVMAPLYPALLSHPDVQPALQRQMGQATLEAVRHHTDVIEATNRTLKDGLQALRSPAEVVLEFGRVVGVPHLYPEIVPRLALHQRIARQLLPGNGSAEAGRAVLVGGGGAGKSTIAALVARDEEMLRAFPAGIYWASLGQEPEVGAKHAAWLSVLKNQLVTGAPPSATTAHLQGLFANEKALFILDDVWNVSDLQPFLVGGPGCATLVTTREARIAEEFGVKPIHIGTMSETEALDLLKLRAAELQEEPRDLIALVETLGYLPLAVALAARQLADGVRARELREAVRQKLGRLDVPGVEHETDSEVRRKQSLEACLELSLSRLSEGRRGQLSELSLLQPSTSFDASVAAYAFGVDASSAQAALRDLASRSLLETEISEAGDRLYRLHAVVWTYVRVGLGDEQAQRERLDVFLEHCNPRRPANWDGILENAHLAQELTNYLVRAEAVADMHALLSDRDQTNDVYSPNLWFEARRLRGQDEMFGLDVGRIHAFALNRPGEDRLDLLAPAVLANVSLNEMNSEIDLSLCRALVTSGLWSHGHAAAHAKRRFSPGEIAALASQLNEPFGAELAEEAIRRAVVLSTIYRPQELIACAEAARGKLRRDAIDAAIRLFGRRAARGRPVEKWTAVPSESARAALRLAILCSEEGVYWSPRDNLRPLLSSLNALNMPRVEDRDVAYQLFGDYRQSVIAVEILLRIAGLGFDDELERDARQEVRRLLAPVADYDAYAPLITKAQLAGVLDMDAEAARRRAIATIATAAADDYAEVLAEEAPEPWMELRNLTSSLAVTFADDLEFLAAATRTGRGTRIAQGFVRDWLATSSGTDDDRFAKSVGGDFGLVAQRLQERGGFAPAGDHVFTAPRKIADVLEIYVSSGLVARRGRAQQLWADLRRVQDDVDRGRLMERLAPCLGVAERGQAHRLCMMFTNPDSAALAYIVAGTLVPDEDREPFLARAVQLFEEMSMPDEALRALSRYVGKYHGRHLADLARAAAALSVGIGDAHLLQRPFVRAALALPQEHRVQRARAGFWDRRDSMPVQPAIPPLLRNRAPIRKTFWSEVEDIGGVVRFDAFDQPQPGESFLDFVTRHLRGLTDDKPRAEHYDDLADICQELVLLGHDAPANALAEAMYEAAIMYR